MDLPGLTRLLDQTRVVGGVRVLYRFTYTVKGRTHAFDSVLMAEDPPWRGRACPGASCAAAVARGNEV